MYSSNVRVLILDVELNRIRDYVTSVPHRATGGLLLGNHYLRNDVEFVVITRTTTRIPDERLTDETCANHPLFTVEDIDRALEGAGEATFLGRWHAHLDGLNRPTASDFQWAHQFLMGTAVAMPFILHPIAVYSRGEVGFFPYIVTRDGGSFEKVVWQPATAAEIERIRTAEPATTTRDQDTKGMFTLAKMRDLFREESVKVAALANVLAAEVHDDGSSAILEVEMAIDDHQVVVQITGDPWYPLNAPGLRVHVDGRASSVTSRTIGEWTSMCSLRDVVHDVAGAIEQTDALLVLPPPQTHETDPIKREVSILQAAHYRVHTTPAARAGTLLTIRSTLLDSAGKVFYSILPRNYPHGAPACAVADKGHPLADVAFETIEPRSPDFTLLTWFERMVPAARDDRVLATTSRRQRARSVVAISLYLLLFCTSAVGGFVFQASGNKNVARLWRSERPRLGAAPGPSTTAQKKSGTFVLDDKGTVLAVVVDAGVGTNMSTHEARWAVASALHNVSVSVVQVDLRNPEHDLERTLSEGRHSQVLIVFSYGAGDRQADFVKALAEAARKPVGVVSMTPGLMEDVLQDSTSFYQAASSGGKSGAQHALLELKSAGTLVVK